MDRAIEILKSALEHEVRAEVFYAKAAVLTHNDESRMVFLELSGMEDDHARRLVNRCQPRALAAGFDAAGFLGQLEADTENLLTVEVNRLIREGEMADVLEFAIQQEEYARDNYLTLAGLFDDAEVRAFCEELSGYEQRHVDALRRLRASLDMEREERAGL